MVDFVPRDLVKTVARCLEDSVVVIADVGLEKASSGALDGIPVIGMISTIWKGGKELRHELYLRQIGRFCEGLRTGSATKEECTKFTEQLERDGKREKFGEAILLLLERMDDIDKPIIVGRIWNACIGGHIEYDKAMRLSFIVNRCYTHDLEYIRSFREGTQGPMTAVAEALFSAGLLLNAGFDYGEIGGDPGGTAYVLNEWGEMLRKFGWPDLDVRPSGPDPGAVAHD